MAKEAALTTVWREHQNRVQQLRDDAENKRRIAFSSAHTVTGLLAENVNGGVSAVFSNQRQIEAEAKLLQSQVVKFSKQTTQWVQMIEGFNTALKELGDIENWVKTIERDMATIASSLEYAAKAPNAGPLAVAASLPSPVAPVPKDSIPSLSSVPAVTPTPVPVSGTLQPHAHGPNIAAPNP